MSTQSNTNDESGAPAPRPFPNADYIRPGIDDRPDLDKALTPEDKAAVARLAVRQKPRSAAPAAERPEVQATAMEAAMPVGSPDEPVPSRDSAFLDMRDPMVDSEGYRPTKTEVTRMKIGFMLTSLCVAAAVSALEVVLVPARLVSFMGPIAGGISFAWVIGIGLVVSLVAAFVFLPLSDRTRTPIGRRTPWFAAGALVAMLFTFALGSCQTVTAMAIVWVFIQIGLAAMLGAMHAAVGERVPDKFRAAVANWRLYGIVAGLLIGVCFGALMTGDAPAGMDLCAVALLCAGVIGVLVVPREKSTVYLHVHPMTTDDLLFAVRAKHANATWRLVCAARGFASLGLTLAIAFIWFVVVYHQAVGKPLTASTAMLQLSLMALLACAASLLAAGVLDMVRTRWDDDCALLVVAGLVGVAAVHVPIFVHSTAGLYVFAGIGGFAVHLIDDALQSIAVSAIPDLDEAGGYLAVFNTSTTLGRIGGIVIGGIVIGMTGAFYELFAWCAVAFGAMTLCAGLLAAKVRRG